MLNLNAKAPDLEIHTHTGYSGPLSSFWQDGPLILFFYPKDDTKVCTEQACTLQTSLERFASFGANVLGCGGGDMDSHRSFAEDQGLTFPLILDEGISKKFNAYSILMGIPKRITYVIDTNGIIIGRHQDMFSVEPHMTMIEKTLGK